MFPYLRLGPYLIHAPGLALLVGLLVGISLTEKESVRLGLHTGRISSMIFFGLLGGIIAARLAYAAQYASGFLTNPLSLLSLNTNTLSPGAGALAGLLIAGLYGYLCKLPFRQTLDALTPGLAFFIIIVGLAHFLSGDAYGAPTRLPWAIYLWSDYRHPAQIYEMFLALVIFAIVITRRINLPSPGLKFVQFVALSAIARIFLEAFRGDSIILAGGFRAAQVMGLIVLLLCIFGAGQWGKPEKSVFPVERKDQNESTFNA